MRPSLLALFFLGSALGLVPLRRPVSGTICRRLGPLCSSEDDGYNSKRELYKKRRAEKLGLLEGETEEDYDLYAALDQNTDDLVVKIIAGAFIAVMAGLEARRAQC